MTNKDAAFVANVMNPVIQDITHRLTVMETKIGELGKETEIKRLNDLLENQRQTITNLQQQVFIAEQRAIKAEVNEFAAHRKD